MAGKGKPSVGGLRTQTRMRAGKAQRGGAERGELAASSMNDMRAIRALHLN